MRGWPALIFAIAANPAELAAATVEGPAWPIEAQAQDRAAMAGSTCPMQLLESLGWTLTDDGPATPYAGQPCRRGTLREIREAGDMRARRPVGDPALVEDLLESEASRCGFRQHVHLATAGALAALDANPGYRFSGLQAGWISFGRRGPLAQGWQPVASFGRAYRASDRPSEALAAFTQGFVRAECGVGRQVAQYATLAELFGSDFDRAFAADEIVIGRFGQLAASRSVLLGDGAGKLTGDGQAIKAARRGRRAFAGAPGFLRYDGPFVLLSDWNNQAQNFVVADVTADAADALRSAGGFAAYNARQRQMQRLARHLEPTAPGYFQRVLGANMPSFAPANDDERAVLAKIRTLLDDPFYRGFLISVHPHGVRSVGWHVIRELDRNPHLPFVIELANSNLETEIYRRYIEAALARCERGEPITLP